MELLLIIIICIAIFYLHFKPRNSVPLHEQIKDPLESLVKPVIEDSSLLKAELAETQEKLSQLNRDMGQLQSELRLSKSAQDSYRTLSEELKEKLVKVTSQKKSSEVRTGTFVEILAPISEQFPVNPKTMRFLGSPIDYISFDYDTNMITLVEVKSGESQLNSNQKAVKKMVEDGRVEFKIVRLNEQGIKVK